MNGFWRITVLGLFGAVGAAAALALATSTSTPGGLPPLAAAIRPDIETATGSPPRASAPDHAPSVPRVEVPSPPIAQQPAPAVRTHDESAASQPPSEDEAKAHLREMLQRAARAHSNAGDELPPDDGADKKSKPKTPPRIYKIPGEGGHNLAIHIQDADLRDVLELLSEQGGLNILPSASVQGKVSAALNGVDVDTALHAILRSTGYISRRDGKFVYVGTPADFKAMDQAADKLGTRVYRLNYVRAADVKDLVTPLLTPGVGSISVTAPAESGIGSNDTNAGGDQFAGGDSVLVRDFGIVLDQIEQVIGAIDRKPAQVAIEAMILSVTLNDEYRFGVDFEFFRNNPHVRLATGTPLPDMNSLNFSQGGLKFAYIDGNTSAFISAVETIGDTNVIASPRLMCINKARAEILIGEQLGYVNTTITETSTAQNVQFLEVGAQLRLRPYISSDGLIRMEVHPELSTGTVQVRGDFTLPEKRVTQVTTNVMIPDGCTVIIGGLMREDLTNTTTQVPLLGSMPGIGFLFRRKTENIQKREILVLITPHIVCEPDDCCEGDESAAEFHRRQAIYADQMSPIGKRYLGRRYYRLAQSAWASGDRDAALRFIDLAVHFDPENRAAIDLRVDIWNGKMVGDHTLIKPDMMGDFVPIPGMVGPIGPDAAVSGSDAPPVEFPWSEEVETPDAEKQQPANQPVPAGVPQAQNTEQPFDALLGESTNRKPTLNGLQHSVMAGAQAAKGPRLPGLTAPPLGVAVSVSQDDSEEPVDMSRVSHSRKHAQATLDGQSLPDWLLKDLAKPNLVPITLPPTTSMSSD